MNKLVTACSGVLIAALMFSTTALAADGPGASQCGRTAGLETAMAAEAMGGLGGLISTMAPINAVNHYSLCLA
ncbi:MAG: hypothetical protein LC797_14740 [Chloroflexi bacterium]|nr:hypothetical protein [Chloroflexota bacterium]